LLGVLDMLAVLNQMRKQSVLVDHSTEKTSVLVQSQNSIVREVLGNHENRVSRDSSLENLLAGSQLVDIDKPELGHNVKHPVFFRNLNRNRKVIGRRGIVLNLSVLLVLGEALRRSRNLSHMNLRGLLTSLSLDKAEDIGSVSVVVQESPAEGASVSL